jgi:hypothetical protein
LGGAEGDSCAGEFCRGEIGEEEIDSGPREEEVRGATVEFRAIQAENVASGAMEESLLLCDDSGLGVPDAQFVHAFGGEESDIELPELEALLGGSFEERGLGVEELTCELEDLNSGDGGENFADGQIGSDDRDGGDGVIAEGFGDGEDGRACVEEVGEVGFKKCLGGVGDFGFGGGVMALALPE